MLSSNKNKNKFDLEGIQLLAKGVKNAGESIDKATDEKPEHLSDAFSKYTEYLSNESKGDEEDFQFEQVDYGFQESPESNNPLQESWVAKDDLEPDMGKSWVEYQAKMSFDYSEQVKPTVMREINGLLGMLGGFAKFQDGKKEYLFYLPEKKESEERRSDKKQCPFKVDVTPKQDPKITPTPEKEPKHLPTSAAGKEITEEAAVMQGFWMDGMRLTEKTSGKYCLFFPQKMGWSQAEWISKSEDINPRTLAHDIFKWMVSKSPKRATYLRKYMVEE
uniref:Phosphoprotein n=1 Tax=Perhabdovirus anguilla TaxID=1300113 RepID=A0A0A1EFB2_9RHAB|nr:phosphoprotein [Perhabdovirus anguilla]